MSRTDTHLSIGEVLSFLQEEFPDVTISKIRFLESQGLIDPERTPSGYRKFYEGDIQRLRWVLRQQRDHFLPLKVIKAKLDAGDVDFDDDQPAQPNLWTDGPVSAGSDPGPPTATVEPVASPETESPAVASPLTEVPIEHESAEHGDEPGRHDSAAWLTALQESPRIERQPSRPVVAPPDPGPVETGRRYSLDELSAESGLPAEVIDELVEFGLLSRGSLGGQASFDDLARGVARAAGAFVSRGVEPRHLRAYKLAAEREAGLFEQLILPLLRQRNPQSQLQAAESLAELTHQGEELHRSLLRQALRAHLHPH